MGAFSTWVQSHSVIVIGAAVLALGFRVYGLVQRQRAFSRRMKAMESKGGGWTIPQGGTWRRLRNGAMYGAVCPGVFSVLVWIVYLLGGRIQQDGGVTTDLLVLSIAYPVGAILMGAILGLALPAMRNFVSSSIVGAVATTPFIAGIALAMDNGHWTSDDTVVAALLSLFFGMAIGYCATILTRKRASAPNAGSTPNKRA